MDTVPPLLRCQPERFPFELHGSVVEETRAKLGDLAKSDEDVLSYIAFPNLAEKYLENRKAKEENIVTYSIVEA